MPPGTSAGGLLIPPTLRVLQTSSRGPLCGGAPLYAAAAGASRLLHVFHMMRATLLSSDSIAEFNVACTELQRWMTTPCATKRRPETAVYGLRWPAHQRGLSMSPSGGDGGQRHVIVRARWHHHAGGLKGWCSESLLAAACCDKIAPFA